MFHYRRFPWVFFIPLPARKGSAGRVLQEGILGNFYKSYFMKNPGSPIRKQKFMSHDHP
jgi:hypothetical protein